jgi:carbamoyl-phosphate synthase large subunit
MIEIGEPVLPSAYVRSVSEAVKFAQEYSFPIIIRSAYTLGGTGSSTAHDMEDFYIKVQE